jgi:hypothetical protein
MKKINTLNPSEMKKIQGGDGTATATGTIVYQPTPSVPTPPSPPPPPQSAGGYTLPPQPPR